TAAARSARTARWPGSSRRWISTRTRRSLRRAFHDPTSCNLQLVGGRRTMSAPDLVRVTIDEVEVHVPKGTGLVETALAAGVEIPVFCYEPRLGPPVGACRMCLVEVEGMPKLQAGCTLTAQDGLMVKTARTSAKA